MSIDWDKPIRKACSKFPCRLIYTLSGKEPGQDRNVIVVQCSSGREYVEVYPDDTDCVENVPEKREYWMNLYRYKDEIYSGGTLFSSENEAINGSGKHLLSSIKVWEEEV